MNNQMKKMVPMVVAGLVVGLAAEAKQKKYQVAELNYVLLEEGVEVAASPIITVADVPASSHKVEQTVKVELEQIIHPSLSGLGGAFNEQGGEAFMRLPEKKRAELAEALFNPKTGAGLTFCRTAIGSSDFGLGAYSYSETPDDYEMKDFSVERDTKSVIPFIRAAMVENPQLKMFASPWSPPAWMKKNGVMDAGRRHDRSLNVLKDDPEIYKAYALYFEKYVKGYAQHGVTIERIVIQNETDMSPVYPGCDMHPEQLAKLVSEYIRPQFKQASLDTELWAGTFRGVSQKKARMRESLNFMKLPGHDAVDGLGMQYCSPNILSELRETYPTLKLMHTEGRCANGANNLAQARGRFDEIAMWLTAGCENYCYWNMVLNEEGKSAWGWKQNSLIRIDREKGRVIYNPDFAPVALMSRFIRPGDQLIKTTSEREEKAIAVRNNRTLTVLLQNQKAEPSTQQIDVGSQQVVVDLPANSVCAVVLK